MKICKDGDYERKVTFDAWNSYDVFIVFTESIAQSRTKRYGSAGGSDGAKALHVSAEGGRSHLFFKIGNAPSGVIAHECWHAIRRMMVEWAGVEDLDNETVAYHLGWLVGKVVDFRNDLIDAGVGMGSIALKQSRVLGVKSSSRKQAVNENDRSGRVSAVIGGHAQEESGTPQASAQADGCGDLGSDSTSAGCC